MSGVASTATMPSTIGPLRDVATACAALVSQWDAISDEGLAAFFRYEPRVAVALLEARGALARANMRPATPTADIEAV